MAIATELQDRTVEVLDLTGAPTGASVELPGDDFDRPLNVPLIHQVVTAQLAALRKGTHATKTRADVSGGGRKPFRQKGTGNARQGSTRAPQLTGGGVAHGPQPRDYSQRTPKKMKAGALRSALSDRARNEHLHVVDNFFAGEKPSTKAAKATLQALTGGRGTLVVLTRGDELAALSLGNLTEAQAVWVDRLTTYDVMAHEDIIFSEDALDAFIGADAAAVAEGDED